MAPTTESKVDVLVIGAGPAGVMCANGLARAGVNVRIIDKRPVKVAAGQADGIQPRTLEVLQSYGLAQPLLDQSAQMIMAAFYQPSAQGGIERIGRVPDVTAPTARFPYEATLHQGAIENLFLDSMRKEGLEVERPIIPVSLEVSDDEKELKDPTAYPVKVTLQHLDADSDQLENKTEVVRAKFVVGCDGAHSWVRRTCGWTMDGEQTDYIWGVVDMYPDESTDFPDTRCKTAIHSHNGSCMIIPREGDKIRLYIQLTDTDAVDPVTGRVDLKRYGPARLMEVAKKSFHPYTINTDIDTIDWWTIYQIGQRVASNFTKKERVFIAGDACHTHSPKAGQGMNASMNDTHNLIWKLTHVIRGDADISLLKTYEFERRKYAQDLIAFDKKFSAMFSGKFDNDRPGGLSHEQFLAAFQGYGAFTSGIGIHYAPSAITVPEQQDAAKGLIVGQRLLPQRIIRAADAQSFEIQDLCPADTRFKVMMFVGETTSDADVRRIEAFLDKFEHPDSFFSRSEAHKKGMLDLLTICKGTKDVFNWNRMPYVLRRHWTQVLLDDTDVQGQGGKMYETYGISDEGALVIIRPDGYVGTVAHLTDVEKVNSYFREFGTFMN